MGSVTAMVGGTAAANRGGRAARAGDDSLEFIREMAGGPGTRWAIPLLAGLGPSFSDAPNTVYGLPEMYRLPLSVCSGGAGMLAPGGSTI